MNRLHTALACVAFSMGCNPSTRVVPEATVIPPTTAPPATSATTPSSAPVTGAPDTGTIASSTPVTKAPDAGATATIDCYCMAWVHLAENGELCYPSRAVCDEHFRTFGRTDKIPCSVKRRAICESFACVNSGAKCYRLNE